MLYDVEDRHYNIDAQIRYDRIHVATEDHQLISGNIIYYTSTNRTGGDGDLEFGLEVYVKAQGDGTAIIALDSDESYRVELATGAVTPL